MPSVLLGENSKLTVLPGERDQIQKFYRDVLGCTLTKTLETADVFQIGSNFCLGVARSQYVRPPEVDLAGASYGSP